MRTNSVLRKRLPEERPKPFLDDFTWSANKQPLFFEMKSHHIVSESHLISTKDFRRQIKQSLVLLKEKAPGYYGLIELFKVKICATDGDCFCADLDTDTIEFPAESILDMSPVVLAAYLIHETIHIWQSKSGQPCMGTEERQWQDCEPQKRELEAIKHQLIILRCLGAEDDEIKFQEKQRGTHAGFNRYQP